MLFFGAIRVNKVFSFRPSDQFSSLFNSFFLSYMLVLFYLDKGKTILTMWKNFHSSFNNGVSKIVFQASLIGEVCFAKAKNGFIIMNYLRKNNSAEYKDKFTCN
jgi:2-hydroxy-3-keto-5-methylthiopentenyl-1-phosphate phosphatase